MKLSLFVCRYKKTSTGKVGHVVRIDVCHSPKLDSKSFFSTRFDLLAKQTNKQTTKSAIKVFIIMITRV